MLHYSRDEDGEEFNSEDMVEMYDGIYVKAFVIFFGELIRYYITEEHDNSIEGEGEQSSYMQQYTG